MIRQMLISSSMFIGLVLLAHACLKNRIPGRIYVILWEIALLRLILPLKIPILPNISNHIATFSTSTVPLTTGKIEKNFLIIWGIGFSISLIIVLSSYYKERMILAQSLPTEIDFAKVGISYNIPIRISDQILSPVVYGTWNPCVVLPKSMNYDNLKLLRNILLHEKVHIFWKDNLVKSLAVFIFCLYWFDPFVWILYYFLSRDMEFACDEEVISKMDYENRKDYALCIYEMADYDVRTFSVSNRFGRNPVKERIVKVMKFKKHTNLIIILAMVFTTVSAIGVFASNENDKTEIDIIQEISSETDHGVKENVISEINPGDSDNQQESEHTSDSAEDDFSDSNAETDRMSKDSVNGYDLHPYYRTPDMTDEEVIEIEKLHEYNRKFFENHEN